MSKAGICDSILGCFKILSDNGHDQCFVKSNGLVVFYGIVYFLDRLLSSLTTKDVTAIKQQELMMPTENGFLCLLC